MRNIAVLSGVAALGVAAGWVLTWLRKSPADLERRRRAAVQASGRLIEGVCTDVANGIAHYEYRWRGVEYSAAQDLSAFADVLPEPDKLMGPITVKFMPKQPSNSILFSEDWNGFRR